MYQPSDGEIETPVSARSSLRLVSMSPGAAKTRTTPSLTALEDAVLRTLAYADVFDFPLDRTEIVRYCFAPAGSAGEIGAAVETLLAQGAVCAWGGYLFLPGREDTVFLRRRLALSSRQGWRVARRWGKVIWMLPFVRMVAVTGSLAVDSMKEEQDIDYMIVVEPGHLWLTRALCLLVWRLARQNGAHLCPNYFVTTKALTVEQHNLYTARELVQMVPLHGREVAARLRASNHWSLEFLPNACLDVALASDAQSPLAHRVKQFAERVFATSLAQGVERWERDRKIAQLIAEAAGKNESLFSADICKDHAQAHGSRVRDLYRLRLATLARHQGDDGAPPREWLASSK